MTVTWTTVGTGHVRVNYTNSDGCTAASQTDKPVTVNPSPSISDQPNDTTITSNNSAAFYITASGINLSYQWQSTYIGSGIWINIPDATSNSTTIPNDSIFKPKSYRCFVNSTCGSVTSNEAKIIVNTNYLSGGEIPDLNNRPLSESMKVGSTAISPSVNTMGAATLNIPIFTSPGTNGMTPSISLFYNSQSGNGILGYGWHFGGLSSITRTGKTMYYDNEVTSISFTTADRFVLNGERLMLSEGTYGINNSVYFPESSPFSKITAYGSTGNGPTYFLEETKAGVTNEYGYSSDSRQFAGNESTTAFSWLLNKVYDADSNYIKYNYSNLNGEYWLRSIVYTGNTAQSLTPYDSLLFNYSIRTSDEVKTRIGSAYIPKTKILQNIIVYCEGVQVHKYEFNYTNGFYSQLVEIKEYGKTQTDTYNPIVIKWGSNGTFSEQYESQITMYDEIQGVETGDYNGDGADEVAIWGNNSTDAGLSLYRLNSYGSFDRVFNRTFPLDYFSPFYKKLPFNSVSDMNGDGIEDLIFSSSDSLLVYMGSTSSQTLFTAKTGRSSVGSEYLPGDFNGDGIGELLTSSYIISFASSQQWSVSLPTGSQRLLVDYDGDGKTDLLTLTYSGYVLTKFTYDKSTNQYSVYNLSSYSSTLLNYTNRERIFQGDFNGDFQTDFIAKDEYGWHILDYNGTQYSTNTEYAFSMLSSFDPSVPANGHALFVRDINNDGKSDMIQITNHYNGGNIDGINLVYHLSKGFDFKVENYLRLGSMTLVNPSDYTFGNFYGDGQLDCLYSLFNMFKLKNNDRVNLVESVLNGMNLRTNFNYKYIVAPSSQVTRPTLDTLVYAPYRNFVVDSIQSVASDNRTRSIEYSFTNPILHLGGKGFLGFANQTTSDKVTGITATTRMDANEKYLYSLPLQEIVKDGENNTLSEKYFTGSTKTYPTGSYFGYISKIISQNILHGVSDTTFYYYDSYGNDTLTVAKQNGELVTITRNQFVQKNTWCPARVSETSQTKTSGSQPSYQTSSLFRYDNLGRLSSTSVFANLQDSLHVDVTYNNYGNISSKNTKLANGSRRSESYSYDSKQRYTTTLTRGTLSFSYLYDAPTGKITKETAPNSLETNYTYDGFGRQTKKSVSENRYISTSYFWSIDSPTGAIYYIQQNDAESIGKAWYDNLGQEIKTQTTGFSSAINKDRIYSKRGLIVQESKPYFSTPDPTWNTFAYDTLGRIESSVAHGSTLNYTYGNNNITSTLQVSGGNRAGTVLYNGLGQVSSTTRSNKSLSFEYDNNGKLINANPPASGSTVSYDYDSRSMLTQESDPDRGNSDYEYNSFGELIGFKTANGDKDSIIYDHIGRDSIRVRDNGQTRYSYYTSGNGKGKLSEISSPSGYKKYTYNIYGNVIRECDSISAAEYFTYSYEYNENGKLSKMTYPGGFAVKYEYNNNGYLEYIKKADDNSIIWKCISADANSNVTEYQLSPGNITLNKSFDSNGYLTEIKTAYGSTPKQLLKYSFDPATGDLSMRKDSLRGITENFGYDLFDQLKWSKVTGLDSLKMDYDDIGNIISKSDVGDYYYNSTRIHAVDSISGGQYPGRQNIEYNFFNKPVYIADAEDSLNYTYSVLDNRIKATLYGTWGLVRTTWYAGLYEKTLENSITKHYYYINGPDGPIALAIQTGGGTPVIYYFCKDHLGSITGIMESDGDLVEEYNYDAWGRRRNPSDWSYSNVPAVTYTQHGFTGHEHLDMFNLINMNGRVYDSEIARFISPDPIIQDPYNIISYNRYTYCLNNPLKYTDPSGYSSRRLWEEEQLRMEAYGQGAQFLGSYPNGWKSYQEKSSYSLSYVIQSMLDSNYGGTWSQSNGTSYFGNDDETFIMGSYIIDRYNYWNTTLAGSFNVALNNYASISQRNQNSTIDFLSPQNFTASLNGVGSIQTETSNVWGKMYIISNTKGEANSMDGHAWIRLESIKSNFVTTMSLWGNRGEQEFWTGLETNYGYGEVSKSRLINTTQFNMVIQFNSILSNVNWTPWNTCAGYSTNLWNYVTGDNLSSRDWFGFTTPRRLSRSIQKNPY
ncbi:MAG: SpvB/TcaC N-terminal domain-containing protein [Sedimentibacter sp.]|uniref:SpvB/TcaC N-terminal domain-containing protein n=1 Tax=Sedimentibacter sp. TaxID=1960295 RepID=UPI0029810CFF|nr:SpvB/TcaC N-terminal domain-containing protein [Sedimentibacter sp.]MDW5298920.1 SpvB/TcaC N-terminal domain-containing protein [Sedimentibacter sp.]